MTIDPTASADVPGLDARTNARWQARFRAPRITLPDWAIDAPERCLYLSDETGIVELYAWDRVSDTHRQVTDRPNGTLSGALTPDGDRIWWFADTDGDEWGRWMAQPFAGGTDTVAAPGVEPAYSAGLDIGHRLAVIGRSTDDGTEILRWAGDAASPTVLYEHVEAAYVGGLSRDESLLAVGHSEHGDSRHMALRILSTVDGSTVAEKWDGEGLGVSSAGFAPVSGDPRLLVGHERRGRPELLIWDVLSDTETEIVLDLPGEVSGSWYADGQALMIGHDYAARTELYRYDLGDGTLARLDTPPGVVSGATARPDGSVEFAWSSSVQPPAIRTVGGGLVLARGQQPPDAFPVEDAWVEGPGGAIHALVVRPPYGPAPYATAFLLHGGPESSDEDAFRARRAAYVEAGYAVVHVNYRGSTGYGSVWRDALTGRPGLTECEDVAAVQDWAIASGLADPARCILSGGSWGGYLTLLALGTQPERWAVGVAEVPVADYLAAYEDEMEGLRAFDRAMFGGSPEEVGEVYRRSSPITYVAAVRAPMLVMAGANDPRCPLRQIENYLSALEEGDHDHEVYRFDAGHGSLVLEETIRQVAVALDFCRRRVPPG